LGVTVIWLFPVFPFVMVRLLAARLRPPLASPFPTLTTVVAVEGECVASPGYVTLIT
jgi:hypothetical protein